jgi:hypothetical protein
VASGWAERRTMCGGGLRDRVRCSSCGGRGQRYTARRPRRRCRLARPQTRSGNRPPVGSSDVNGCRGGLVCSSESGPGQPCKQVLHALRHAGGRQRPGRHAGRVVDSVDWLDRLELGVGGPGWSSQRSASHPTRPAAYVSCAGGRRCSASVRRRADRRRGWGGPVAEPDGRGR